MTSRLSNPVALAGAALILLLLLEAALILPPLIQPLLVALKPEVSAGLPGTSEGWTLQNLFDIYSLAEYRRPLITTVVLSLVVTCLASLIGLTLAFIVNRTDVPGRSLWELAVILPFFLSPFSTAIAWVSLGAPRTGYINTFFDAIGLGRLIDIFTFSGVTWVMVTAFVPVAYLTISGPMRSMDGSIEEAALMVGAKPRQVLTRITLPVLAPGILAAAVLILVLAAEIYSIPALIGLPGGVASLPWTSISLTQNWPPQYGHAAAATSVLLLLTALGMAYYSRVTRKSHKFITVGGKGAKPRTIALGRWKWLCLAILGVYVGLSTVLPYLALLFSSFQTFATANILNVKLTLDNYTYILSSPNLVRSIANTVIVSAIAATLAVLLVVAAAYGAVRGKSRLWGVVEWLIMLPVSLPGVIIGFGVLWTYVASPLYGTILLLILINVIRWQSFGIGVTKAGLYQIDGSLEEAARMQGAGALRAAFTISLPLIRRSLLAAWLFMIVMSMKELAASILVASARNTVLAVATWDLAIAGEFNKAAALAIVQTLLMLALILITAKIFRIDLRNMGGSAEHAK